VFQTWWCISCLARADGLENVPEAVSIPVVPHERQKRITLEWPSSYRREAYYMVPECSRDSQVKTGYISILDLNSLIACVGFCILAPTTAIAGLHGASAMKALV